MSPVETLKKAKELLSIPEHWTTGAFARDVHGDTVPTHDKAAVCWCAEGALLRTTEGAYPPEAYAFLAKAGPVRFGITDYNDDLISHGSLLAWFDRAIALAEQGRP